MANKPKSQESKFKTLLLFTAYLLLFTVFIGCTRKEDTIKIGVAGPLTGDQAKMGMDLKNGVELAVSEWNERGGLLGKKIELLAEDDQHDPKSAVTVANKLTNSEVVGVIGHWNSSASIPASEVYRDRGNIPMLTPASTNPQLTERGFENVFRVCGRDDQQGSIAAEFVSRKLKIKKVAIIHDKTTYGQGLADEFKKALGGVEVVYYGVIIQGDKDFRAVLTSIKDTMPELIYFGGIYPEAGLLIKQAKELGIKSPFMSGDGTIDKEFIKIAGRDNAEGTYLTFSPDPINIPSSKAFLDKYHAKYGEHGPYSIYAYDAANILLTGIRNAGSLEGKKILDAIRNLKYEGALGLIQFDKKGDVLKAPYVVWLTKDGDFKEYWSPAKE
ncbi:MAG: branched-chain amino acid ABC transporter substrate-binding protein [Deltaproteobacteria bacterium]|nr:branched-chain amino acid ABC transporter substrate-binding protein [Deltaproteobacteria bacterium]